MADLERGQRIKELRESRHLTQEAMAETLDVTLRGYQEWEAGGGIKWDNVKKLAKFHKVDADFLMNGPQLETPDPFGDADQLNRIERRLDEIVKRLDSMTVVADEFVSQQTARQVSEAVGSAAAKPQRKPSASPRKRRTKQSP